MGAPLKIGGALSGGAVEQNHCSTTTPLLGGGGGGAAQVQSKVSVEQSNVPDVQHREQKRCSAQIPPIVATGKLTSVEKPTI